MNNLYEVLERGLEDIEQGADVDTVLFHYPEHAEELRPILEASVNAKSMAVAAPSVEVVRRNRARVLQYAAQLRETKARPASQRIWSASLRRLAVSLAVIALLFVSGTNLVRAASTTLPGDNLYPVKRTWEDVIVLFTFNLQQREALEVEHENERLYELRALFTEGRSVEVEFAGLVTSQFGDVWLISGVPVIVSSQTEVRDGPVAIGSAVRVEGHTQDNGSVLAEKIRLLPPDAKLPDLDDSHDQDKDRSGEDGGGQGEDNSGKGSGDEEPQVEETQAPESNSNQENESSNSGPGSDNSGSGSGDNGNDSGINDNESSGQDGSTDNSGHGGNDNSDGSGSDNNSNDSSGGDQSDDSGSGDNSGPGSSGSDSGSD